jgi:hypothetical protein
MVAAGKKRRRPVLELKYARGGATPPAATRRKQRPREVLKQLCSVEIILALSR